MTKQDVIRQVSDRTEQAQLTCRSIIEAFFELAKGSLTEGEPVYIHRFGRFVLKQRASKVARNINQNTAVTIQAHVIPSFQPSRHFTNQVREQAIPNPIECHTSFIGSRAD